MGLCFVDVIAQGCEDLKHPPGMWVKRNNDQIIVGCEHIDRTWNLECIGAHWVGVIGNCTEG